MTKKSRKSPKPGDLENIIVLTLVSFVMVIVLAGVVAVAATML